VCSKSETGAQPELPAQLTALQREILTGGGASQMMGCGRDVTRRVVEMRKFIYPALVLLLMLMFAGGTAQSNALAGTRAANLIGAYADDWPSANSTIGPLQTQKFFYKDGLPPNAADPTSNNQKPGCEATDPTTGQLVYPVNVTCIITYGAVNSPDNLDSFLRSLNPNRHVIMAFCNEPEIHMGTDGCMCDLPLWNSPAPCAGAGNFILQFDEQSGAVQDFENNHPTYDIQFAEDSYAGSNYSSSPPDCSFIVSPSTVSFYLVDVYEPKSTGQNLGQNAAWNGWVSCTHNNAGVTRGIAEYGINCSGDQKEIAPTFAADQTYLEQHFPSLEVWELWYAGGCLFTNQDAITEWKLIEAGLTG
jgi:hypothetical protein